MVYIVCHLIIWSLGSLVSPVKKEAKGCSGEVVLYQMTFDVLAICCGWEISFQVMIYTIGVKISNKCYFPASSSPTANVCVLCSTFVTMWKEKKFSICSCILSLSRSSANFSPLPYFSLFLLIFAYEPATRPDGGFVVNPLTWRREKRGQLDLLLRLPLTKYVPYPWLATF